MNKTFMSGYYQGVIETAPATLSAAKTEQLAITMTILPFTSCWNKHYINP